MATFTPRKAREKKTSEPKPFKPFKLPSFTVDTLEEADALAQFFDEAGNKDAVKYIADKTARFR